MSNEYEEFMESSNKQEKDDWGNTPNQVKDAEEIHTNKEFMDTGNETQPN